MKLDLKQLEHHANIAQKLTDDALNHAGKEKFGACMVAARITEIYLKKQGFPVRVAGGRAMFSLNSSQWGIIDFGYSEVPEIERYEKTDTIGHFWCVVGGHVIDCSLQYLVAMVRLSDQSRGIDAGPVQLPSKSLIRKNEISSARKLYNGKIGWHYAEIPGRGENVWKEHPGRISIGKKANNKGRINEI